jgi:hypothetical protein
VRTTRDAWGLWGLERGPHQPGARAWGEACLTADTHGATHFAVRDCPAHLNV